MKTFSNQSPKLSGCAGLFLILFSLPVISQDQDSEKPSAVFEIFEKKCRECHHPNTDDELPYLHGEVSVKELIADEAIVPGNLEKSIVHEKIILPDTNRQRMPRSRGSAGDDSYREPLEAKEIKLIADWILELGNDPSSEETPPELSPSPETVAAASVKDDEIPEDAPLLQQVGQIFEKYCFECHSEQGSRKKYTLGATSDFAELLSSGKAEDIFDRVSLPIGDSDRMPLSEGERGEEDYREGLTKREIEIIGEWVAGKGQDDAPSIKRETIELSDTLDTIYRDVQENEEESRFHRYFTFANLHNAKRPGSSGEAEFSDSVLDTYRMGLSKLLNHLSMSGKIATPTPVDDAKTVYRIDLRDYHWDAEEWERVVSFYPHGIRGVSHRKEALIEKATESSRAYLRADWFAFAAAQPPLYDKIMASLLEIESFRAEGAQQRIENALKVDRVGNLQKGHAIRAGFLKSGVSKANRLIERHDSRFGGYWVSYDFERKAGAPADGDLLRAPLGPIEAQLTEDEKHIFRHDGGEMIYTLPNGFQGYFLATADGTRLDVAPLKIVQHENKTKRLLENESIINGVSCMECHRRGMKGSIDVGLGLPLGTVWDEAKLGPNPQTVAGMRDEIGPRIEDSPLFSFEEKKVIDQLYASPEKLRRAILLDQEKFLEADEEASMGLTGDGRESISALYAVYHEYSIDALRLASELGMEKEELLEILEEARFETDDTYRLHEDLEKGRAVHRDVFMQIWPVLVPILGFDLKPFEPLGYAEWGGEVAADFVRESPAYIALFGKGKALIGKEAEEAVAGASDKVRSSREILLPGGKRMRVSIDSQIVAGQDGTLKIESERDVYVNIVHYGADGTITQFFPSATTRRSNLISAGRPRSIGVRTSPNVGKNVGKGGLEFFEVTVSVVPVRLTAQGTLVDGAQTYQSNELFTPRGVATAFEVVQEKRVNSSNPISGVKKSPQFLGQARVSYLLIE